MTIRYLIAVLLSVVILHVTMPKQAQTHLKTMVHGKHIVIVGREATPVQVQKPVAVTTNQITGCAAYKPLIARYGWNANVMYAVMQAESGCNPLAVNTHNYDGVDDYGLLQLHGQDILDPGQNIAAGYQKWLTQGYGAWTTYNTGAYLRYLD